MNSTKFLLTSMGLGALVFLITVGGAESGWFSRPTLLIEIVVCNVLVTFILYRWLIRISKPEMFVNGYLGSIVFKLLVCSGLLLTIRIISPQSLSPNAILLMICYVVFTLLEVTFLFLKIGR